ncbi:MAG: D-2-hydroxyacid dehydrogenase [Treponemataceae bacterium]
MNGKGIILLALKPHRLPADAQARIKAIDGTRTLFASDDRKEIEARLSDTEIAGGDFPPDLIPRLNALRWYQSWSAGTDWLQKFPETKVQPFILTSTSGMHATQMNEHLFGLILSWCKKFPAAFAAQSRKEWYRPQTSQLCELTGKTMLILGLGAIGEQTATIARAFGMSVIGVRRSPRKDEKRTDNVRIALFDELPALLPLADVVVNILPYTSKTRDLINRDYFTRMKKTALFANIGRGGTVNEMDLTAALEENLIAGAVLDVTAVEPLPTDSPLWKRENVIITAHYAGNHSQYDQIAFDIFLENLARFTRGEMLVNVVDKNLGY